MSDYKKRFLASIFLKDEKAVRSFSDPTVINNDPAILAQEYSNSNVDGIIVFDLSAAGDDKAHEKALDIIKDICKASDVPVIGAGNVKRMEDIKKLLYAGCKKACLNFSKTGNIEILTEVSEKFGKDRIIACFSDPRQIDLSKEDVLKFVSELIYVGFNADNKAFPECEIPLTVITDDSSFAQKPYKLFEMETRISGISGNVVNDNALNISKYKEVCLENGIDILRLEPKFSFADLKKNSDGMVPVIVQDYRTDQVLMLAYMNEEAYNKTLSTGKMTYFSRSRNKLWLKGETSSHFQYVMSLTADCDLDTILAKVKQIGAACHTGSYSCFFNEIASKDYSEKNPQKVLDSVFDVIKDRKVNPREGSYTNYLFDKGLDKILKKVGEEATEMVIAAKNEGSNEIVYEMSDFLYHMMVLMAEKNVSWEEITDELSRR